MSAFSNSIIRVSVVGDATALTAALGQAEGKVAGIAGKIAGAFVALQIGSKVTDFAQTALAEYDRLGDASTRLELQLGGLSEKLIATAGDFSYLGLSAQDMLELEANFADVATAAEIADITIADLADDVAATAAAVALLQEKDPAAVVKLIGLAAGGSAKAAKELGVELLADVSPAEQLVNILKQLKPKLDDASTGSADLEQKQSALQAKVETLSAKFGELLAPAIESVVDKITEVVDLIPSAVDGFRLLWKQVELGGDAFDGLTDSIGNAFSALNQLQNLMEGTGGGGAGGGFSSERQVTNAQQDWVNRNQGGP